MLEDGHRLTSARDERGVKLFTGEPLFHRTERPEDTCFFCSFNTVSYREKSAARVAEEVEQLTSRHKTLSVDSLATSGTLVVFDIDNTLIEPTVTFGSDQWFYWYVAELEAAGRTARRAVDEANDVWNRVQSPISEGRSKWRLSVRRAIFYAVTWRR